MTTSRSLPPLQPVSRRLKLRAMPEMKTTRRRPKQQCKCRAHTARTVSRRKERSYHTRLTSASRFTPSSRRSSRSSAITTRATASTNAYRRAVVATIITKGKGELPLRNRFLPATPPLLGARRLSRQHHQVYDIKIPRKIKSTRRSSLTPVHIPTLLLTQLVCLILTTRRSSP